MQMIKVLGVYRREKIISVKSYGDISYKKAENKALFEHLKPPFSVLIEGVQNGEIIAKQPTLF